jgi:hypothetical protein
MACAPEITAWISRALITNEDSKEANQYVHRQIVTNKLKKALHEQVIALVVGPSKFGKTWLAKRTMYEYRATVLDFRGPEFRAELGLWPLLALKLSIPLPSELPIPTLIRPQVVKHLKDKIGQGERYALFIDDIHFASPTTLEVLAQDLRALHGELASDSFSILLVGVTSPPTRMLHQSADLEGKIREIDCGVWEHSELQDIVNFAVPQYGYQFKNLEIVSPLVFGSPYLMVLMARVLVQQRCLPIRRQGEARTIYWDRSRVEHAARTVVSEYFAATQQVLNEYFLSPAAHGVRHERDIERYTLRDGRRTTFNRLFWFIAAGLHDPAQMPLNQFTLGYPIGRLFDDVQRICSSHINYTSLQEALDAMNRHYRDNYVLDRVKKDPIFELSPDKVYVRDPYFLFVCRHQPEILKQTSDI